MQFLKSQRSLVLSSWVHCHAMCLLYSTLLAIGWKRRLYVLLIKYLMIRKTFTQRVFRCKAVKERQQYSMYISR